MEVHGSLSVLLDTALCSIVPLFCLTSQLPEMAGCPPETQVINLSYLIIDISTGTLTVVYILKITEKKIR